MTMNRLLIGNAILFLILSGFQQWYRTVSEINHFNGYFWLYSSAISLVIPLLFLKFLGKSLTRKRLTCGFTALAIFNPIMYGFLIRHYSFDAECYKWDLAYLAGPQIIKPITKLRMNSGQGEWMYYSHPY